MIVGIGIDIVEISRIEGLLKKSNRFLERTLTKGEIAQYKDLRSDRRQVEYVAGRFAAKEAFAKARGTGIGQLSFTDIEVLATETGAPSLKVAGYEGMALHLSISHSEEYAVAQVVIEK
ncbi:MAG TPA: holo-ACP synthase [Pseudogracilibacillus sp.]|nr:holo-ACP synthase [Pseudogracilibacillus sp.]